MVLERLVKKDRVQRFICQLITIMGTMKITTDAFNICDVSSSVCIPMSDIQHIFQVNCTCILVAKQYFEVSNETNLYMSGMRIPFDLFRQQMLTSRQRQLLDARLDDLLPRDQSLYLSPSIFINMHIVEYFTLFTCNRSSLTDIFTAISNSEVLLSQVITDQDDVSVVVVSVVRGQFNVARLLSDLCTRECRRRIRVDSRYCRWKCAENIRTNHISIVGSKKHDWKNFLRIAAVDNVRNKYGAFIQDEYRTPQQ
ncbi:unnamed protein product [Anisakis simplex]|uniref:Protein F16 n=1 Tax=Anisakis simplex TaxID=6269 RepID=A0A0M3K0F2_ANISI|nr:unnamed protein product [Anisakis simplex]